MSRKEGNHHLLLHRLIFEEFYGPIPEGFVIHHRDGDPSNNNIENLQLISKSEHQVLHKCKYILWDPTKVHYKKKDMFLNNREPNPCKCFQVRYAKKDVKIGGFIDFVTPTIIHDLIEEEEEIINGFERRTSNICKR